LIGAHLHLIEEVLDVVQIGGFDVELADLQSNFFADGVKSAAGFRMGRAIRRRIARI